jgi:hypothetical protein
MVEARLARAMAVVGLAPPGERDQECGVRGHLLPHASRDFVTIHLGHADVDEHHARRVALETVERIRAAVGYAHFSTHQT